MKIKKGKFITIEGGEGTGKTTLIQNLKKIISSKNIKCCTTREPGGTSIAETLRLALINNSFDLDQEIDIISFARSEHVTKLIKKELDNGNWVLSDRFFDSTLAYQALMEPERFKEIEQYCLLAAGSCIPDLTIWLDVNPEIGLKRAKDKNKFEKKGLNFHKKLRKNFSKISDIYPQRIVKINIKNRNIDEVTNLAHSIIRGCFSEFK